MDGKIKTVVFGTGSRGRSMTNAFHRSGLFEIVGLYDVIPARAEAVAEGLEGPKPRVFSSYDECLRADGCEAVLICSHDAAHADGIVPALEAGKHIYAEKPLEVTWDRCHQIIEADEKAGGKTFVGFNLRYAPVYAKIHELIQDGAVGAPLTIEANEFYIGGRSYFRRWNRLRGASGGLWITKACHDFDLLYWMAGAEPVSVCAFDAVSHYRPREDAPLHCLECGQALDCPDSFYENKTADTLPDEPPFTGREDTPRSDLCLFNADKETFDHGTALARFANDCTASYTCNVVASFDNREMRVSGTEGALEGSLAGGEVTLRKRDSHRRIVFDVSAAGKGGHGGGDVRILNSFADFCRGKQAKVTRPAEAGVAIKMGLAATLSADEGRQIDICEIDGAPSQG